MFFLGVCRDTLIENTGTHNCSWLVQRIHDTSQADFMQFSIQSEKKLLKKYNYSQMKTILRTEVAPL